jgi:hypothetical protein
MFLYTTANRSFAYLKVGEIKIELSQGMKTEKLEQSYKEQLVKAGVATYRAEQAAKTVTREQLQLISEIWPEWASTFSQVKDNTY